MTSIECTNSVFHVTDKNNGFSITIPGLWETKSAEKTIEELKKLLDLKSQNGIELHVEQVRKKRLILVNDCSLPSLDTFKNEILEEVKNVKYNDLEDLVFRFQLTYNEITDIINIKCIPTKRIGYFINPSIYEVIDLNNTLKHILPDNVKVSAKIDDVRLKSNLKTNQTLIFTEKSFFYTILGFTQSHFHPLDDIYGFFN